MEMMFVPNLQEESRICNVVVPSSPVERRAQALKDFKNYQQTGPGLFERFCLAARCTERCSHGRVADSLVPGIFPNTLEARGFVVLWLYHSLTQF